MLCDQMTVTLTTSPERCGHLLLAQLGRHADTPIDRVEAHDPLLPLAGSDSVPSLGIMPSPRLRCDPCRHGQGSKWKARTDESRGGEWDDLHVSLAQAEDKRLVYRARMRLIKNLSVNRDRRGTLFNWAGGAGAVSGSSLFQVAG